MSQQGRPLARWLLAVPIVAACFIISANFDSRLWVGLTALVSALLLRSMVVGWWRSLGKGPLDLMATMCVSFVGAAAATLTITLLETWPELIVFFLTGYIGALAYGTTAEIVAQVLSWALASRKPFRG